jgi:16S rRNA (guanine527-N7)-methyltransferase
MDEISGRGGEGMAGPADRAVLEAGLGELGLALDQEPIDRMLAHVRLVRAWSRSYNLVARGDLAGLVSRHVLDSLAIHRLVPDGRLLDVGSGAGFPGLPLAIALPRLEVTLLDSAGKRARFLRHVVRTLRLERVAVVEARVEDYAAAQPFAAIVSRAFATLSEYVRCVRHLAGPETRVLALKGQRPREELDALPEWVNLRSVQRYHVPDLHAERHVVIMSLAPGTA